MIGQFQVIDLLMMVLCGDCVGYVYFFLGLCGCGKIILVCILVCCLNCVEGFIDILCGICFSCVEFFCVGGGLFDVVEIDVVSYNGVDDVCDLCECVIFVLSCDCYKIFIFDEVYMVMLQGFNVLFKFVEELLEYVKFIFVMIEFEKVFGMIWFCMYYYLF